MRILRFAVLLGLLAQLGCGAILQGVKAGMDANKPPQTLTTADKRLSVVVPGDWTRDDSLHDEADLGAHQKVKELYVVLLDEKKEDFEDMTLEKHAELTLSSIESSMKNAELSKPVKLTINGCPAVQYVINGSVDNIKVVFIHTTIETGKSFCQMLTWTLKSRWGSQEDDLRKVIESFRDQDTASAPAKPAAGQ